MRGLASVLTIAFVFASSAVLVGSSAAQSTEPAMMPPEEYPREPTDAVITGKVVDQAGRGVAGATVSAYTYGPIGYAEGDKDQPSTASATTGSGTSSASPSRSPYYGGNSTASAADGSFRLGVYSGENQLSVYRDGYASAYVQVSVASGQTVSQDVTVQKFPDKTARIEGRVTDVRTGQGLPNALVSVTSPLYGAYECSVREGEQGEGETKPMPAEDSATIVAPDYYPYPGCSITVHPDGRYEGLVTPGYSIVSVYAYSDCAESFDADGSSSSACGPQYFSFSRTLDLPANKTTVVNAALRSHPAPDATVSGYLLDKETGQAIPGAQISFNSEQAYGYGWATTDESGSYAIRLRSGYHSVSVYAEGHLPWSGNLDIKAGSTDFDVELTPGEPSYGGGCCYAPMYDRAAAESSAGAPAPPMPGAAMGQDGADEDAALSEESSQEVLYQDLGGGLGPYDPEERQHALAGTGDAAPSDSDGGLDIPSAGVLLALAALGAVLLARRRFA